MHTKSRLLLPFLFSVLAFASSPALHFDGQSWWEHVQVLADDNMEGRYTGSEGLKRAQTYVVSQLKEAGLTPAGSQGFIQPVSMDSRQMDEGSSSAYLFKNGRSNELKQGEDGYFLPGPDLSPSIEAPLVFAGYGLQIPEFHYDDLAGLDLRGKIVVIVTGFPDSIPAEPGAHFSSPPVSWAAMRKAGAIGGIVILNPLSMEGKDWSQVAMNRKRPSVGLHGSQFDDFAGLQMGFLFNPSRADKLFDGSQHQLKDLLALAKTRKPLPRFPLSLSFRSKTKMVVKQIQSANVIAKLPGSDPALSSQYVVLSAHLDHVGIGEPVNGDRIYNGAMDNASGSAVLLDVASALKQANARPKRSLLFVFVTGEEEGELGSRFFAREPTVDKKSIVADINVDMFLPLVPLKTLNVYGLKESTLGDTLQEVAKSENVAVQADPHPERSVFTRSDNYSFVKEGIPSISFDVAFVGKEEEKVQADWLRSRYHEPSDDINQPVNKATAGKFEEIMSALMLQIANTPEKPAWKQSSFFRRFAQVTRASSKSWVSDLRKYPS